MWLFVDGNDILWIVDIGKWGECLKSWLKIMLLKILWLFFFFECYEIYFSFKIILIKFNKESVLFFMLVFLRCCRYNDKIKVMEFNVNYY